MDHALAGLRPQQTPKLGQALLAVTAVVALVAGTVITAEATRLPSFVPRLSMQNPTPFEVEVDAAPSGRGPWLSLGGVRRDSTKHVYEVIDQGDRWVFRFSYGGVEAGEVAITASELRSGGWRVTIPPGVGDRLRAEGMTPSA